MVLTRQMMPDTKGTDITFTYRNVFWEQAFVLRLNIVVSLTCTCRYSIGQEPEKS